MTLNRTELRTAFTLALIFLSATDAAGQDPVKVRADSLRMAGDLRGAVEAYLDVFNRFPDDRDAAYGVASTFALHGGFPDSAFHYLEIALRHDDTVQPLWDADLYFLTEDERWKDVEAKQLDKLADQVKGRFQREYARQLLRIRLNEWAFRYHIMLAYRTLGPESPIVTALSKSMGEHHNENSGTGAGQSAGLRDTDGNQ